MRKVISFKVQLLMGFGVVILLMIVMSGVALFQFFNVHSGLSELREAASPQAWAAEKMALDVIQVQQFLTDVSATHNREGYQEAEEFANDLKKTIKQFRQHNLSAVQVAELAVIEQAFDEFHRMGKRMAEAYITEGIQSGNVMMEEFDRTSLVLAERMTKFRDVAVDREGGITTSLSQSARAATDSMSVMTLFGVLMSSFIALFLNHYLAKQLGIDPFYAKSVALEIAQGNLEKHIEVDAGDNISLLYAMKHMQQAILGRIATANKLIDEATRIKIALDNASTGVMIVDNERAIIYANKAVVSLLSKVESDIRIDLPDFSVDKLVGSNIDLFHKISEHQATMIAAAKGSLTANVAVHGHHFSAIYSPVIDEQGHRLGTTAEWVDRTTEIRVETDVAEAIKAAVRGDFSYRIDHGELHSFYEQAAVGINQLMQICNDGLNDVVRVLNAMALGDLTVSIDNQYAGTFGQLKDHTNTTAAILSEVIGKIKEVSDSINSDAKEMAAGNNDLSHRTEEQAASLEQTASSMQELTTAVRHNAKNAKQANDLAISAVEIAGKGGDVVHRVVVTMEEINESSRKIVDIIAVIDGIAFQTNILALNAAVEAARAGEQGRGFAVVAIEVRNLAQRAAAAAGEIKSLIADSVDKVEQGVKLVNHAGKTMAEIVHSITGVTAMMAEITRDSEEQGTGIAQVNLAIGQMDTVTQQNAALVEQAAATAESLEGQAQDLTVIVSTFKVARG